MLVIKEITFYHVKEDYSIWMKARMTKDSVDKDQDKKVTKETYICY